MKPRAKTSLHTTLAALKPKRGTLVTIGVFDGVHLGHKYLIDTLKRQAASRGLLSLVITFDCHPQEVVTPQCQLPWLTTTEERVGLIRDLKVDLVAAMPFDEEVASVSAREFLEMLSEAVRMKGLVVGPDFALGRGREGDISRLNSLGREMGFTLESVLPLVLDGMVVSSTAVRRAVARGDVRLYHKLVGRSYVIGGEVIRGAERGRRLGFPTANLSLDPRRALPADGVYATWAHVHGKRFASATNIGVRPTFDKGERLAEVHMLDFQGDLYGQQIKVELVERLRQELKFNSLAELQEQMKRDIARTRVVLETKAARR